MDTDNMNLNDAGNDYREWWEGVKKEASAKVEKMDAEERMKHASTIDNFSAEADAAKDWVAADWEQFKGRVQQWTNSAEIKLDKAI
ncbi:MAG TPA: hypothetical protein VM103_02160 [Candidatus Paceibacterota bacterium]|nr:hypothetical protein [Candidatus Paceibacterota bacterium]